MKENLYKNCKKCWYYYHTNCTEDNDLIAEDLSNLICDGFSPNIEYNTDTSTGHPIKDEDIVRYSLKTRRV